MRQKMFMVLCAVVLSHAFVWAEPTAPSLAAVEKLGALRARVSKKMDTLQRLLNPAANGVTDAGNTFQAQYSQTVATEQKRVQQESIKPADVRDQALIDSTNAKLVKAYGLWNAYNYKDLPVFTQKMTDLQVVGQSLSPLVATFVSQDQNWLRADLDPAALTGTLAILDKRIDEITTAATPLIANYIKLCTERTRTFEE